MPAVVDSKAKGSTNVHIAFQGMMPKATVEQSWRDQLQKRSTLR